MNQDLKARVSTWLQQHRGDIVRDIFTLSRIPSVKGAPAPGAPFGKACRAALDEAGIKAEITGRPKPPSTATAPMP